MNHNEEAKIIRMSHGKHSLFADAVIRILNRNRERITEHRRSLFK